MDNLERLKWIVEHKDRFTKEEFTKTTYFLERELCKENLAYLVTEVLDPDYYKPILAPFHYEMMKFAESIGNRKLILVPRGHFKSSLVTIPLVIQKLLVNPDARILLTNATLDNSQKFLRSIKGYFEGNEKLKYLFGEFKSEKWNETEIVIKQRKKLQIKESSIIASSVEKGIVSQHFDMIIADDLVNRESINTKDQMDKTLMYYRDLLDLIEPGETVVVIGCLVAGTSITNANGTKTNIEDMKVGDKVVTYKSVENVEAVIPQGIADVWELKTKNNTIVATKNHPFLTKNGFQRLDKLKIGDYILACGQLNHSKKSDYSEIEMETLGFMFGDGWITRHPNSKGSMRWVSCMAKGIYEEYKKYQKFLEERFNFKFRDTDFGYITTETARVGRYFEKLGLIGKAKTKRIPEYIFSLPLKLRLSFLKGFIEADGHYDKHKMISIELCNEELIKDIKHLANISGYKVSNIYKRTRFTKAPNSPVPIFAKSAHISFPVKRKKSKFFWTKITSIKYIGKKEVFDLTVSNTHNFVAEGLITHNTRWHFDDLYDTLLKDGGYKVYFKTVFEGDNTIFPLKFTKEYLEQLRKEKTEAEFSAQYLNTPIDEKFAPFKEAWLKNYFEELPDDVYNYYLTLDTAGGGEGKNADANGWIVNAVNSKGEWYILEADADKLNPTDIINKLFAFNSRYPALKIGIEKTMYTNAFKPQLEAEQRKRGEYLQIEEIKNNITSKEARIKSLIPKFQNGMIFLRKEFDNLRSELLRFPKSRHDDLSDSLANQNQIAVAPSGTAEKDTEEIISNRMDYAQDEFF